jgi:hypothetical protein
MSHAPSDADAHTIWASVTELRVHHGDLKLSIAESLHENPLTERAYRNGGRARELSCTGQEALTLFRTASRRVGWPDDSIHSTASGVTGKSMHLALLSGTFVACQGAAPSATAALAMPTTSDTVVESATARQRAADERQRHTTER